jgi:two-component system chemotaxis sensor kinase CheA
VTCDNRSIGEFVTETRERLVDVERGLALLQTPGAATDVAALHRAYRAMHAIKGAADCLGLSTVTELARALEDVLNLIRNRDLTPSSKTVHALREATGLLGDLCRDVEGSRGTDVSHPVETLQHIVASETAPAVRDSMERLVRLKQSQRVTFSVSEQLLEAQQRVGNALYVLELELVEDVDARGHVPIHVVKELLALGEVLDARLDTGTWGGLDCELPSEVWFVVLLGTRLSADLVADALGLPPERIHPVNMATVVESIAMDAAAILPGDLRDDADETSGCN